MKKSENTGDNFNYVKAAPSPRNRKRVFLKIVLIIFILFGGIIAGVFSLSSNTAISRIIEEQFTKNTGLNLKIDGLDLDFFKGQLILKNSVATTPTGKNVASFNDISLKLNLSDLYDLYLNNNIQAESLEISGIRLSDIPYLQLINEIAPQSITEDYNLSIATFLNKMHFNIDYVYLKKQDKNTFEYRIKGVFDGKYSGGGEISGIISNFSTANISEIEITAKLPDFKFNIVENGLESTYNGILKYSNSHCDFKGILTTNKSPLAILAATSGTTYKGSGVWDLKDNILVVDQATITNTDGMLLQTNGTIVNPTDNKQYEISANITESQIQLKDIQLKDKKLNLSIPDNFSFTGKTYIARDKLDIKGKIAAKSIKLTDKAITSELSSDFSAYLTANRESLLFENIECHSDAATLNGSIFIPNIILKGEQTFISSLKRLELNLNLSGKLSALIDKLHRLDIITADTISATGKFNLSLVTIPAPTTTDFTLTINSNDNSSALTNEKQTVKLGAYTGKFQGQINEYNKLLLNTAQIKSAALNLDAAVDFEDSNSSIPFRYALAGDWITLLCVLYPEKIKKPELFDNIVIKGSGHYTPATAEIVSEDCRLRLHFPDNTAPAFIDYAGSFSITARDNWPLTALKSTINLVDSDIITGKEKVECSAILNLKAQLISTTLSQQKIFAPTGSASLGLRSTNSMLVKLLAKLFEMKEIPYTTRTSTLKAKIEFTPEQIDISSLFDIYDFTCELPVDFSAPSLHGNTELIYKIADKRLKISELKAADKIHSYEFTAAGNYYLENSIFEGFNCKLNADINSFLSNFKGYGNKQRFYGNIELISELIGTADFPSLTIVGKSDKIRLSRGNNSDTSTNIRFDAKLNWSRDNSGNISAVKADEIFLQSSNAAVYITGIADQFHLEKNGIVNFGKGVKFDVILKGNRKLLWMLIPGFAYTTTDPGIINSINISANVEAQRLPIFNFEDDVHRDYHSKLQINSGKLAVDTFTYQGIKISELYTEFSLNNQIAKIINGKARVSGDVSFSGIADFTGTPRGTIKLNLAGINLAKIASTLPLSSRVLSGSLTVPAATSSGDLTLSWAGSDFKKALESLSCKRERAQIKDLIIESINQPHPWEDYLSADFPPVIAKQLALEINKKLAPTYGKKQKSYYSYFDIEYSIGNGAARILRLKCGGGNTADFLAKGVVAYNGKIRLRVYPVKNIQKSFDTSTLLNIPSIQSYTSTLSPEQRKKFNAIIPGTLERLAREEKLYIDITGTIAEPLINVEKLREEIRRNIPEITRKFNQIMGQGGILKLLLKDIKSEKLKGALGINGDENSLKSGSSLGDILKLFE